MLNLAFTARRPRTEPICPLYRFLLLCVSCLRRLQTANCPPPRLAAKSPPAPDGGDRIGLYLELELRPRYGRCDGLAAGGRA